MILTIRRTREQKGAAMVEFALAMPIVFILLFGIVEFGLAFWRKQLLTAGVREGARYGVVSTTPRKTKAEIQSKVSTYLTNVGLASAPAALVTFSSGTECAKDQTITVTQTYPTSMTIMSNLSKLFWGSSAVAASKTLQAQVTMQCE
jgi:Flp pilus assembly protein TadG